MRRLDEIAKHAETHDFSTEIETGTWEADTGADPMVTTSLRLPKSLLDWVGNAPTNSMFGRPR